ncbi:MAG: Hsp20/alpha crystallin family protein [Magnetovibrio sp.]|nr:Hsp20/alpha crystallin family protein [Magnetovibrio sp.]
MVDTQHTVPTPQEPNWWTTLYDPLRHLGRRIADFFTPDADAAATEDAYEITMELPGVAESDISVEVHDNRLTVTGEKKSRHEEQGRTYYFSERTYGAFRRAFRLPDDSDADKVHASFKDGVLTIKVAKLANQAAAPRKIEISRS